MKIPDPGYERGVPSMGRADPGMALSLGHSLQSVVSAKGQVRDAINKVAGVAEAWAHAEDKMAAARALGDYNSTMSQVLIQLQKSPSLKPSEIPEEISVRRYDKAEDGTERERVSIPSWEAAPQIYDYYEKQARAKAMSAASFKDVRNELELRLQASNIEGVNKISAFHLNGRKAFLEGSLEAAVQLNVTAGKPEAAKAVIADAVNAGIIDYKEGVKRIIKVENDSVNMEWGKKIAESKDPTELRGFADSLLTDRGVLTDEQALGKARQAMAKADHLEKAQLGNKDKEERKQSQGMLAIWVHKIRIEGQLPSKDELKNLGEQLHPLDFISLINLIDKKDGGATNDPTTVKLLNDKLTRLTRPDPSIAGWSMDKEMENFRLNVDRALQDGRIDRKTWDQYQQDSRQITQQAMNDPAYKQAQDLVHITIAKVPKGTIMQPGGDASRFQVAQEMEIDLMREYMKNPQMDPLAWVQQNLPKYQLAADKKVHTELRKDTAVLPFIRLNPSGGIDEAATAAALAEAKRKGQITDQSYKRAINAFTSTPRHTSAPTQD